MLPNKYGKKRRNFTRCKSKAILYVEHIAFTRLYLYFIVDRKKSVDSSKVHLVDYFYVFLDELKTLPPLPAVNSKLFSMASGIGGGVGRWSPVAW